MKTSRKLLFASFIAVASIIFFAACQKETSVSGDDNTIPAGKAKLSVYLTDGPLDFIQSVMVDIQRIEVKIDTCRKNDDDDDHDNRPGCDDDHDSLERRCEIWDTLKIRAGVYDLLKLRNGVDTLLGSGLIPKGKIERIKIVLGSNNSITIDSVVHPLRFLNNQNFLFVNIHREHFDDLSLNNLKLLLDFDLFRSIRFVNGQFILRPVLKLFSDRSTGRIEGKVKPKGSFGTIYAFNSAKDTAFARPDDDDGEFKIRGLKEGTYSLFIDGINGYRDTTINNIDVRREKEVKLGTIELKK
jgi:Domain of unknown function (DUF4382)